ncbi:RNA-guided endonuclease InsQ/TnpB family protein [Lactobacillus kimbladii]|uniref:RNA-guided endonuclease InsQ/TnpB family protein n=1 Tax=Lactobacillus kimbladii TaxID=1218506 RepID=UPI003AF434FC
MIVTKTQLVRLCPNQIMTKQLVALCDYRRYCWNQGLATWNDMYEANTINPIDNPKPNQYRVRNELVANKEDWQDKLSARCLQLAIKDLAQAWQNFFDKAQPDWGKPQFKSKKAARQGFKTDRAKIINGKLRLDRPRGVVKEDWFDIKLAEKPQMTKLLTVSILKESGHYTAALTYQFEPKVKAKTGQKTAVDVNVGHFNWTGGNLQVLPRKLVKLYERIKHYQRQLARKRTVNGLKTALKSCNYQAVKNKLQRDYRKVNNIQTDLLQKFTTKLVTDYDQIVIEDLDVKAMKMGIASKGLHRSMFGKFRQELVYKCKWYGKELVLASRLYPSTQRCANCGYIKTGSEKITLAGNVKHHTKHNEYICYQCGYIADRDENAVRNLLALAK